MRVARRASVLVAVLLCGLAAVTVGSSRRPAEATAGPSSRIVFTRDGIWIMDASGANPVQLTSGEDLDPQLSPGGTQIAFGRIINNGNERPIETVWVMNADGTNQHQVFTPPGSGLVIQDRQPAWSPDGTKIAFVRDAQFALGGVMVMNVDGSDLRAIRPDDGTREFYPAWSPDGTKIAYVFNFGAADGGYHIVVANADGSGGDIELPNPTAGIAPNATVLAPSWSPDGGEIAFGWGTSVLSPSVWTMRADGTHAVQLTQGSDDETPSWSPDGTHLAFVRSNAITFAGDVFTMKSDGTEMTRVIDDGLEPNWEPWPRVVPGVASIVEGNSGTKALQMPVSLTAPSRQAVTASWKTLESSATAPADFVARSGTVTFAPGETSATVPITINGDALDEADELLLVSFTDPTNASIGGFFGLGFGVIVDDDLPPVILPGAASVLEGNTGTRVLQIPVSLSAPSGQIVTASWMTLDRTAVAPGDYVAASGPVIFAPGQTTTSVSVTVSSDTIDEADELLLVSFTKPTNATIGGFFGLGFGTIIDDDPPPAIAPGQASILEGNSGTKTLQIPVSLSAPSGQTVTASWTTLDYSAIAPADYQAASGTVIFQPGQTTQTVSVNINGDTLREPDEFLVVSFTNPVNATLSGFLGLGFGTIINDD